MAPRSIFLGGLRTVPGVGGSQGAMGQQTHPCPLTAAPKHSCQRRCVLHGRPSVVLPWPMHLGVPRPPGLVSSWRQPLSAGRGAQGTYGRGSRSRGDRKAAPSHGLLSLDARPSLTSDSAAVSRLWGGGGGEEGKDGLSCPPTRKRVPGNRLQRRKMGPASILWFLKGGRKKLLQQICSLVTRFCFSFSSASTEDGVPVSCR